ncbi:MAG TPA: hypothetical protein PKX87_02215, partial [Alphaproteobacteria bacterium]|nr:hypothetical protein [Alphaproteobacteria bacterium]
MSRFFCRWFELLQRLRPQWAQGACRKAQPMDIFHNNYSSSPTPLRFTERGNIFFMLFGAVALVGVLGAATVSLMRGPLTTMVEVNRRTMAESQMSIASKLGMMTSALQANDGDCEAVPDGFVEPYEWEDASNAGPDGVAGSEGGGWLANAYGVSKKDPWGTNFGYCVWDAGTTVADAGCGGAGQKRLAGSGTADRTYPVLALISAGPDRTFQTGCVSFATGDANSNATYDAGEKLVVKAAGSDDVVLEYTYAEASMTAGGLWELKAGQPNTAETPKSIEVGGGANFAGGSALIDPTTGQGTFPRIVTDYAQANTAPTIDFVDGLKLTNTGSAGANCSIGSGGPGLGTLGVDNANPTVLLGCLDNSGTPEWTILGGVGVDKWLDGTDPGDIHYPGGMVGIGTVNPSRMLDVAGDAGLTGDLFLADTKAVKWGDASTGIQGSGPGSLEILTGGSTRFTVDSSGLAGLGVGPAANTRLVIQGTGTTSASAALNVTDSAASSILYVQDDKKVGIGTVPNDALDVTGAADVSLGYKIDGNVVVYVPDGVAENILVGKDAGSLVSGDRNAVLGASAAAALAAGTDNVVVGQGAAGALSSGDYNTLIGQGVGPTLATGVRNILIGAHDSVAVDVPAAATDDYLNIGNTIYGDMASDYVGIGVPSPNDALDVAGNIDATGNVNTGGNFTINSVVFGPALECTAAQKLEWDNATGWSCVTDLNDGSAGSPDTLEEVLTSGNDANTLTAVNLGGVAIGSAALSTGGTQDLELDVTGDIGADWYCDADGNNCFNAASVGSLDTFLELTDTPNAYTGAGGYIVRVNPGATGLEFVNASSVPGGAAGNDTEIQYNNGGALGAEANLTYDPTTDFLINNSGEIVSARLSAERFDFRGGWGTGLQMPVANEMGIFTNGVERIRITSAGDVSISGTGAMKLHAGTTAQRPGTPVNGMIRYNSTANKFEVYENGAWKYIQTGASTGLAFTDLTDTPAVYTGAAYKLAMVNAGETGIVFSYTDAVLLPSGTTAERPGTPSNGMIRYNSTNTKFEVYQGGAWVNLITSGAGSALAINDLTDAATDYVTDHNMFIGQGAGAGVIAGANDNLFIGENAGAGALTAAATGNVFIGYKSGNINTSGGYNTAVGRGALEFNTIGSHNTVVGWHSSFRNSTGAYNTILGEDAFAYNTTGNRNTIVGRTAGYGVSTVTATSNNVFLGYSAGYGITTGGNNTLLGYQSGDSLTTGANNLLVGYDVDTPAATTSNFLNIGDTVYGDLSTDQIRIGGSGALSGFSDLDVAGTMAVKLSSGTTAQRPSTPTNGMIRYNADNNRFEAYENGAWINMIGGAASSVALSSITAATAANTIGSGDYAQMWNWALTTATKDAFTFGETSAATGGSGDQSILKAATLASS